MMKFRHELKHTINMSDRMLLSARLSKIFSHDIHSDNGIYYVKSLYFDNYMDKSLREKIDGVNCRDKFRIRFYNNNNMNLPQNMPSPSGQMPDFQMPDGGNRTQREMPEGGWGSMPGQGGGFQGGFPGDRGNMQGFNQNSMAQEEKNLNDINTK